MVIFDGDCGVCTALAGGLQRRSPAGTAFVPAQMMTAEQLAAAGITRADCLQRVYYVTAAGAIYGGGRACVELLHDCTVPGAKFAAAIGRAPVVRAVVEFVYGVVAPRRALLSRLLGLTACRLP